MPLPQIGSAELLEDRYRIEKILGSGGQSTVYLAHDLLLQRQVVLKFPSVDQMDESGIALKRFEQEAKALSLLVHPNIVQVFRSGLMDGTTPFLALEYIDGRTLREELNSATTLNCRDAVKIAIQICSAMEFSHSQKITHRDLKPENILLKEINGEKTALVFDFGLCKISSGQNTTLHLTRTGAVAGTVSYMSPEQCRGQTADARSDIYAFACLFFEMITGRPPFLAEAEGQVLLKHLNDQAPSLILETKNARTDNQRLSELIAKCLEKDPAARYQDFQSIHDDLMDFKNLDKESKVLIKENKAARKGIPQSVLIGILSISIIALTLTAYFAYQSDYVQCRIATARLADSNSSAAIEELDKKVRALINEGRLDLAVKIVNATTKSQSFSHLSLHDQSELLYLYFKIFNEHKLYKDGVPIAAELLSRLLSEAMAIDKGADPPQIIKDRLNEVAKFLLSAPRTSEWVSRLSFLKKMKEPSAYPSAYLTQTAWLRGIVGENMPGSGTWNSRIMSARDYVHALRTLRESNETALAEKFYKKAISFRAKIGDDGAFSGAHFTRQEFDANIILAEHYIYNQFWGKAEEAYKRAVERAQHLTLSSPELFQIDYTRVAIEKRVNIGEAQSIAHNEEKLSPKAPIEKWHPLMNLRKYLK